MYQVCGVFFFLLFWGGGGWQCGWGVKFDEMEVPEVGLWMDLRTGGETKALTSLQSLQFIAFDASHHHYEHI